MPELIVPEPPPPTHVPEIEKQPAVRLRPLSRVEVAPEVSEREPPVSVRPAELARPAVERPVNVDVALVLVALKEGAVTRPVNTPAPVTESGVPGVVVPMPKRPPLVIRARSVLLVPSTRLAL